MKTFKSLVGVVALSLIVGHLIERPATIVRAQSFGGFAIGPISPTVAQCPPGVTGQAVYCPVGSSTLAYATYVSYNAGAYSLLVPQQAASVTGTDPIVVSSSGVISLNSDAALHALIASLNLTASVPANSATIPASSATVPSVSAPVK